MKNRKKIGRKVRKRDRIKKDGKKRRKKAREKERATKGLEAAGRHKKKTR